MDRNFGGKSIANVTQVPIHTYSSDNKPSTQLTAGRKEQRFHCSQPLKANSATKKIKRLFPSELISEIASNTTLQRVFEAVYQRRKKDSYNSDLWDLILHWEEFREQLFSGEYQLSPMHTYSTSEGLVSRFGPQDVVVLKSLSLILAPLIKAYVGERCYHLAGCGGVYGAAKEVARQLPHYTYVIKSDVSSFYDTMNHAVLMREIKHVITDKKIIRLIYQYLNRCDVLDGEHRLITRGILMGCRLSPLMRAIALKSLDAVVESGCAYVRYMDDWVILTKTHSALRRIIRKMHRVLQTIKFKLARDKTFIGSIPSGFDFLGIAL
ncbi:reverse transcriptase/maturase family protein [Fluoribacter gormanii]|uniref:reverse transcriptase/maturase family protein n=1 Tax=Fluoribacter gormanii TaxID=464 RepID=UPI0010415BE1|nr:reverse transcriptase/maturase family protein [Fluoribacter gormanii]